MLQSSGIALFPGNQTRHSGIGQNPFGSSASAERATIAPHTAKYLHGNARFGARKTINAPPAAKKIPVAPCRSVPAKKTAAAAASNRTTCTTADRKGG
jgi:hypothetical protein